MINEIIKSKIEKKYCGACDTFFKSSCHYDSDKHRENKKKVDNLIMFLPDYLKYSLTEQQKSIICKNNEKINEMQQEVLKKFIGEFDVEEEQKRQDKFYYFCESCDKKISSRNKAKHQKTEKHLLRELKPR